MGVNTSKFCVTDVINFAEYNSDGSTIYLLGDDHSTNKEPGGFPEKSIDSTELVEALKKRENKTFIYLETPLKNATVSNVRQVEWGLSKYITNNRDAIINKDEGNIQHIGVDTRQDNPIMEKYFGNTSVAQLQIHILNDRPYKLNSTRSFTDVVRTSKLLTTGNNSLKHNIRLYLEMMTSGDYMSLITKKISYANAINNSNNWGREFIESVHTDLKAFFDSDSDSYIKFNTKDLQGSMPKIPDINMAIILDKVVLNIMENVGDPVETREYIKILDDEFLNGVSKQPRSDASIFYNKKKRLYDYVIQLSERIMFYINSAIVDIFTLTSLLSNIKSTPNAHHIIWLGADHIRNLTGYLDLIGMQKKFFVESDSIIVPFINDKTKQEEYTQESIRNVCGALPNDHEILKLYNNHNDHEILKLYNDPLWTKVVRKGVRKGGGLALLSCVNIYMVIIILLLVMLIYIITKTYSNAACEVHYSSEMRPNYLL
jgi:hypothetical protein